MLSVSRNCCIIYWRPTKKNETFVKKKRKSICDESLVTKPINLMDSLIKRCLDKKKWHGRGCWRFVHKGGSPVDGCGQGGHFECHCKSLHGMVVYGFTVSHLLSFKGLEKPTRYGCVPLNAFFRLYYCFHLLSSVVKINDILFLLFYWQVFRWLQGPLKKLVAQCSGILFGE